MHSLARVLFQVLAGFGHSGNQGYGVISVSHREKSASEIRKVLAVLCSPCTVLEASVFLLLFVSFNSLPYGSFQHSSLHSELMRMKCGFSVERHDNLGTTMYIMSSAFIGSHMYLPMFSVPPWPWPWPVTDLPSLKGNGSPREQVPLELGEWPPVCPSYAQWIFKEETGYIKVKMLTLQCTEVW